MLSSLGGLTNLSEYRFVSVKCFVNKKPNKQKPTRSVTISKYLSKQRTIGEPVYNISAFK